MERGGERGGGREGRRDTGDISLVFKARPASLSTGIHRQQLGLKEPRPAVWPCDSHGGREGRREGGSLETHNLLILEHSERLCASEGLFWWHQVTPSPTVIVVA